MMTDHNLANANNANKEPPSRCDAAIPPRAGAGLKPGHYQTILQERPDIGFFEIHAENYMRDGGPPHAFLTAIRADYPISLHGVGLSIGGPDPLDKAHLARLRAVNDRYEPGLFSEHLAWSTHDDRYLLDLLPLAYNRETLTRVVDHIDEVQNAMGRQMLLENPSTYLEIRDTSMPETEFLREVTRRSGCGLLLDVNNVQVTAVNHSTSPWDYLASFPLEHVRELHLGGHAEDADEDGNRILIDAHDREVDEVVWDLYRHVTQRTGPLPSLIEWDDKVPEWSGLFADAQRADAILAGLAPAQIHQTA